VFMTKRERSARYRRLRQEIATLETEPRDWLVTFLLEIQDDLRCFGGFGKFSDLDAAERHLQGVLEAIAED
jgi:hypothetical protein